MGEVKVTVFYSLVSSHGAEGMETKTSKYVEQKLRKQ
jgi:hypothetical protein